MISWRYKREGLAPNRYHISSWIPSAAVQQDDTGAYTKCWRPPWLFPPFWPSPWPPLLTTFALTVGKLSSASLFIDFTLFDRIFFCLLWFLVSRNDHGHFDGIARARLHSIALHRIHWHQCLHSIRFHSRYKLVLCPQTLKSFISFCCSSRFQRTENGSHWFIRWNWRALVIFTWSLHYCIYSDEDISIVFKGPAFSIPLVPIWSKVIVLYRQVKPSLSKPFWFCLQPSHRYTSLAFLCAVQTHLLFMWVLDTQLQTT